jgi:hypothetical protein
MASQTGGAVAAWPLGVRAQQPAKVPWSGYVDEAAKLCKMGLGR